MLKPGGIAHAIESDWSLTAVEPLAAEWRALVAAASWAWRTPEIGRKLYGIARSDVSGAITWLDPAIGWDLSAAAGFTFSQTNTATDYKTGDEFHLEWGATKYITKQFTLGLVGYYYRQLTADSGSGARLGAFEGRVVALGGTIGYTFEVGKLPISTRLKVYREFDVQNRMEGTADYFTVSLPIGLDTNVSQIDSGKAIKARF